MSGQNDAEILAAQAIARAAKRSAKKEPSVQGAGNPTSQQPAQEAQPAGTSAQTGGTGGGKNRPRRRSGGGGSGNGGNNHTTNNDPNKWKNFSIALGTVLGMIVMIVIYTVLDEWDLAFKVRKSVAEVSIAKNQAEAKKATAEAEKKEAEAKKMVAEAKAIEKGFINSSVFIRSESCPKESDFDGIVQRNNVQAVGTVGAEYHFGPGCVIVNLRISIEQLNGTGYYFSTIDQSDSGGFKRPAREGCGTYGDGSHPGMNCASFLNRHRGSNVMVIVGNGGNITMKGGK